MDTVTGNSSGETESENIEVTPTIYQNYSGVDDFGQQVFISTNPSFYKYSSKKLDRLAWSVFWDS